jgi:hypothetical protein
MIWQPDDIIRLLAMSTVMDIVVAAYPTRSEPMGFFIKVPDGHNIPLNEHGCAAIDGMGMGLAMLHRRVLEDLSAKAPLIRYMTQAILPWVFKFEVHDGAIPGRGYRVFRGCQKARLSVLARSDDNPRPSRSKRYSAHRSRLLSPMTDNSSGL